MSSKKRIAEKQIYNNILHEDTCILTRSGYKKLNSIKKGDFVFNPYGGISKITSVKKINPDYFYILTFNNGQSITCGDNTTLRTINSDGHSTKTTVKQMYESSISSYFIILSDYVDCASTKISHLHRTKSLIEEYPELKDIILSGNFSHFVTLLSQEYASIMKNTTSWIRSLYPKQDKDNNIDSYIEQQIEYDKFFEEVISKDFLVKFSDKNTPNKDKLDSFKINDSNIEYEEMGRSIKYFTTENKEKIYHEELVINYLNDNLSLPNWFFVMPLEDKINSISCIIDIMKGSYEQTKKSTYITLHSFYQYSDDIIKLMSTCGCPRIVDELNENIIYLSKRGRRKKVIEDIIPDTTYNYTSNDEVDYEDYFSKNPSAKEIMSGLFDNLTFCLSRDVFDYSEDVMKNITNFDASNNLGIAEIVHIEKIPSEYNLDNNFISLELSENEILFLAGKTNIPIYSNVKQK